MHCYVLSAQLVSDFSAFSDGGAATAKRVPVRRCDGYRYAIVWRAVTMAKLSRRRAKN